MMWIIYIPSPQVTLCRKTQNRQPNAEKEETVASRAETTLLQLCTIHRYTRPQYIKYPTCVYICLFVFLCVLPQTCKNCLISVLLECIQGQNVVLLKHDTFSSSLSPLMTGHMFFPTKFWAAVTVLCQPLCCPLPSAPLPGEILTIFNRFLLLLVLLAYFLSPVFWLFSPLEMCRGHRQGPEE